MRRQRQSQVVTRNFVVTAPDAAFAQKVAREAERFRRELSIEWLGYEIKPWSQRCPIAVRFEHGAGGKTSFAFYRRGQKSLPTEWDMEVFGPPERILDSVLPHEVTHTIFATHFGRPLLRWADEGACTAVEHESERKKNHQMLLDILSARPSRGIPFNRMFTMYEYPQDLFPLYAQGYSLARFLLAQKSKAEFIRYVETGIAYTDQGMGLTGWDRATKEVYGFEDLSELQMSWVDWVKKGSKEFDIAKARKSQPKSQTGTFVSAPNAPTNQSQDSNVYVSSPQRAGNNYYAMQMRRQTPARDDMAITKTSTDGQPANAQSPADSVIAGNLPYKLSGESDPRMLASQQLEYRPGSTGRNIDRLIRDTMASTPPAEPKTIPASPQFRPPPMHAGVPGQFRSRPTIIRR